jgi:hypothetical protein
MKSGRAEYLGTLLIGNYAMKKAIPFMLAFAGIATVAAVMLLFGGRAPARPSADITPVWTELRWPFLLDQWGVGRAFVCKPQDCGVEVNVYLRPKIGFCKCATGVDDDDELERVSDIGLLANKTVVLGPGRPIEVGWMKGRSRRYAVAGSPEGQSLSIAFNDQCDVIVALATLEDANRGAIEQAVIAFLNSDRVLRWVKWLIS